MFNDETQELFTPVQGLMKPPTTVEKLMRAATTAGLRLTQVYITGDTYRLHVEFYREDALKEITAGPFTLHPTGIVRKHGVVLTVSIERAVNMGEGALMAHLSTMREILETLLG